MISTLRLAISIAAIAGCANALGPAAVKLGTAGNYVILAQTGISTVPPSAITGLVGVSPAAGTFLTGFSFTLDSTGTFATSPQVTGELTAASFTSPTPSKLTTAVSDMQTAYNDAATRSKPDFLNLASGNIGGLSLPPGLYKWTSGVSVSSTIDLIGGPNDVFIFQIAGTLTFANAVRVTLIGGVSAKNIVWAVADSVSLGTTSHFEGILLAKTAATLKTGTTMNGRVLSQTQVALQKATIVAPS